MRRAGPALAALAVLACAGPEARLPERYRALEVPGARLASPASRSRGRVLYERHCALCHGERADGRGVRRSALSGPPADFTAPAWRARHTPRTVYHAIREGVSGTSMPAWPALGNEETWDLVAYLLAASEPDRYGPSPPPRQSARAW